MEKVKITFPDEIKKPLIINGSKFISLFDLSLTEKEIVKANKELSETKEKKEKCIKKLRDKLAEDEDATYRTDEEYLLSYLRVRKFDWSKAYENIRAASIFRKKNPEILKIPPNLESLLKLNLTLYSPYVDENGNLIMLFDVEKWNDKEMSFNEVMQMCTCMHDIILMNPRCQINGLVVIWDVKGISVRHVTNVLRNTTFGTLAYYLQNYYAIRLKHAYFINTSRLSQLIFKMARPFLAKKIAERVVFFGSDLKELHQVVNPALLPRTFGGSLEEDQCSVVYEMILRNVRYLKYPRLQINAVLIHRGKNITILTVIGRSSTMDLEEFAENSEHLVDYIINYFQTMSKRTVVSTYRPGYLKQLLPPTAPVKGESFEKIMEDFDKYIMPGLTHWQHPDFHGYYPCLTSYPSILANALSDIVNCVGFNWNTCPSGSELSEIMLEWYGKAIGLPRNFLQHCGYDKGGGLIQNTVSECVLISMITARQLIFKRISVKRPNASSTIVLASLVAYCTKESDFCIQKAAMLSLVNVRVLETDEEFRLRGKTLSRAITEDKNIGLIPFFVSISLGSATGACDPLDEIGPICEEYEIWLNVDAAYAGNAFICPEFRHYLRGIEFASSICICPAKWLLMCDNCCLLFVRDRFKVANYVQANESKYILAESKEWRYQSKETYEAFKLFIMMHCHGIESLQEHIRNHVRLATLFAEIVRKDQRFEVLSCHFGIVCFRLKGTNEVTKMLLQVINLSSKLIVNSYTVNEKFVIRFVICSANANEDDILRAWHIIQELTKEVLITHEMNEKLRVVSSEEYKGHLDYRLI